MSTQSENLTGVWHGLYSYPQGAGSVAFVATLIEFGTSLTGSTHEPRAGQGPNTLLAILDGGRQGQAVSFRKTYQGAGPEYGTVDYDGALTGDGTEIEGHWRIPDAWSGKFLMVRSAGKAATIEHKQIERA